MRHGEHMLVILAVLITLFAVVIIFRARVPGGVNAAQLGGVSERWLTAYRASQST